MQYSELDPSGSYTFSDYFKTNADSREIAKFFGYRLQREELDLLAVPVPFPETVHTLQIDLREISKKVYINSEQARREFLIAPILFLLSKSMTDFRLNVEKYIFASDQLKGSLDYYLSGQQSVVVIEAKNSDIVNGMKQLVAELIALDKLEEPEQMFLHGAVSIGDDWRFARLNRAGKEIIEDIKLYRVPEEIEILFGILFGLLGNG